MFPSDRTITKTSMPDLRADLNTARVRFFAAVNDARVFPSVESTQALVIAGNHLDELLELVFFDNIANGRRLAEQRKREARGALAAARLAAGDGGEPPSSLMLACLEAQLAYDRALVAWADLLVMAAQIRLETAQFVTGRGLVAVDSMAGRALAAVEAGVRLRSEACGRIADLETRRDELLKASF